MTKNFFKDIDSQWVDTGHEPIDLKIIGSTALFLQTDYSRGTKDSDILEIKELPKKIFQALEKIAGRGTPISKKHGLYIDLVTEALPFLPSNPIFHEIKDISLKHFRLSVLDVMDVVISKLKRFSANDVDDIQAVIALKLINPAKLLERFQSALDHWLMDARAEELDQYIENLHTVERDFLFVKESQIDLPRWLKD